ncbi:MAG: VanZ family protein [Cellulosilyticaceae bacterium]
MLKKMFFYKFTLIVLSIILYSLFIPSSSVPSINIPGLDKVVHMAMFFGLTTVFIFEFSRLNKRLPNSIYVLFSIFAFAALTEILQATLTDSRAGEWLDLVFDMSGCIISISIYQLLHTYFPKYIQKIIYLGTKKR